nr:hypothetical protein [Tanacetum cinerariifolium]
MILETIHVEFNELIVMASECTNLEPKFNCTNFQDSLEDSQSLPSKIDLDNLFGPLYKNYYSMSSLEVSDNSNVNTLNNENTSSSSSIVPEETKAPRIVSSSTKQVTSEPDTPVLNENADKDSSNIHEFHQTHHSTDKWTKNHPIEQVIGNPSKQVMTRCQLHTDAEVKQTKYHCMIGGLMYLTTSRPDITFETIVCARYQDSGFELIAYSDADHAGCNDDCKITSEGIQFIGDKLVSWSSKKQDCTAMSTTEAEYVSLSACCAQVIWMRT